MRALVVATSGVVTNVIVDALSTNSHMTKPSALDIDLAAPPPPLRDRVPTRYLGLCSDPSLVSSIIQAIESISRVPSELLTEVAAVAPQHQPNRAVPILRHESKDFGEFVATVILRANSHVVLLSIVLLVMERLKMKIEIFTRGKLTIRLRYFSSDDSGVSSLINEAWPFLTCMVVASTYVMGMPISYNKWSEYTDNLFAPFEIASMERHCLTLCNYNLKITMADLGPQVIPLKWQLEYHQDTSNDQ